MKTSNQNICLEQKKALFNMLCVIYIMNLLDAAFTYILQKHGFGREINFLLKPIVNSAPSLFAIKGGLVALLVLFIINWIQKASEKQLHTANILIKVLVVWYSVILSTHIAWMYLRFGKGIIL